LGNNFYQTFGVREIFGFAIYCNMRMASETSIAPSFVTSAAAFWLFVRAEKSSAAINCKAVITSETSTVSSPFMSPYTGSIVMNGKPSSSA